MKVHIICYPAILLAISHIPLVHTLYFHSGGKKANININESYTISSNAIKIPESSSAKYKRPLGVGKNIYLYRNVSRFYTTDERCEKGFPLGMALLQFAPYVKDHMNTTWVKKLVVVNG